MSTSEYFHRPNNIAFHDLTKGKQVPNIAKHLLGLSRKFIPAKKFSQSANDMDKPLENFERDCHLKVFFADTPLENDPPPLYMKSQWRPPTTAIPRFVHTRLHRLFVRLRNLFKKRPGKPNLLPFQRRLLLMLRQHDKWLIANTDKNLGPCAIEIEQYKRDALTHLSNKKVYKIISKQAAQRACRRLERKIHEWVAKSRKRSTINKDEAKFITAHTLRNSRDPCGYFYLTYKVHKPKLSTRPVCSDCASITNPLSKWVDVMLQPINKSMPTYFKDSYDFKERVDMVKLRPGARLFTSDAVSMYTNIDTNEALASICPFLRHNESHYGHYDSRTLIRAIKLVMKNNIIKFGDVYARQVSGTAMGKPPAPTWAGSFEGIRECKYQPKWKPYVPIFLRYVDDIWGAWDPPPGTSASESNQAWQAFKAEVNLGCLEWEFTERAVSVQFLDMNVTVTPEGKIKTSLYEKPMALYLFIPPHSAHPPGVLKSHINGNILRIFRLNTDERDRVDDAVQFFQRFLDRGYHHDMLKPLFQNAIMNARTFMAKTKEHRAADKRSKAEAARRRLYLHVEHHPENPSAHQIQQAFYDEFLHPPGEEHINTMDNGSGWDIPIDSMIIANHRAKNLGDLFSYRDIAKQKGPPVSQYL